VTKKEIVKTISEEIGLTQLKTKEIVQKTFDAIVETLVADERIELRNFGVFEVKKRAARKARNPRTGQRVNVPEKYVVTFKPGKEMEERVRLLSERKAAQAAADAAGPASSPLVGNEPPPTPMGSAGAGVAPAPQTIPHGGGSAAPQTSTPPPQSFGQYGGDSQYGTDPDRPS
jgi:nucleoid DNA-binding protein